MKRALTVSGTGVQISGPQNSLARPSPLPVRHSAKTRKAFFLFYLLFFGQKEEKLSLLFFFFLGKEKLSLQRRKL